MLGGCSQTPSAIAGRICAPPNVRLADDSIYLEGSIRRSQGQRTRLNLSKLEGYRVFPGQVHSLSVTTL